MITKDYISTTYYISTIYSSYISKYVSIESWPRPSHVIKAKVIVDYTYIKG